MITKGFFDGWWGYLIGRVVIVLVLYSLMRGFWSQYATHKLRCSYPELIKEEFPSLFSIFDQLSKKMGIKRNIKFYSAPYREPLIFTTGWIRPAIFIHPSLIEELSAEELEAVLAHELAHIQRRDNLLLWLGGLLKDFFLFLPFKNRLWEFFLNHREESCDDIAAKITEKPLILAQTLIKIWEITTGLSSPIWRRAYSPGYNLVGKWSTLQRRVERLINPPPKRPLPKAIITITALMCLIFIGSLTLHVFGDRYYCQTAVEASLEGDYHIALNPLGYRF